MPAFLFVFDFLLIEEPFPQIFSIFESILHAPAVEHDDDVALAADLEAAGQAGARSVGDAGLDSHVEVGLGLKKLMGVLPE